MDPKILLGKILQRFKDQGKAQVDGYQSFGYIKETSKSVMVTRERGQITKVPFSKILVGIEAYQSDPKLYHTNTSKLREYGITHVTSPVFALLHLLEEADYKI